MDPVTKKAAKCDLCGGDPACMKACEYGAIEHVDFSEKGLLSRERGIKPAAKMQTVQEEI
jgi:ferredoxin